MFYMPVDMTVDNPNSSVVHRCPQDDVSIGWNLDNIFENWPFEVPWKAVFSIRTLCVHFLDCLFEDRIVKLTRSHNIKPAPVLMYWMGHTPAVLTISFPWLNIDQYNFKPIMTRESWLLDDMLAVTLFCWWDLATTSRGLLVHTFIICIAHDSTTLRVI